LVRLVLALIGSYWPGRMVVIHVSLKYTVFIYFMRLMLNYDGLEQLTVNYSLVPTRQLCLRDFSCHWPLLSVGWEDLQIVRLLPKEITVTTHSLLNELASSQSSFITA
jgi:hypothetical protein